MSGRSPVFPSHHVRPDLLRGADAGAFGRVDARVWTAPPPAQPPQHALRRRPVRWLTYGLLTTYGRCNPAFHYRPKFTAPRRVLTNPSIPRHNEGNDNENYDLILHVGDTLGSAVAGDQSPFCWRQGSRYTIIDMLGQGTFGQVVKCRDEELGTIVAIKVLKNKPAYFKQGLLEVGILTALNTNYDPTGDRRTLRVLDHFLYQNHLCIVTELLSMNLYELVKQNGFRGVSARLIRIFLRQVLDALEVLDVGHIIHCDLKPENILLQHLRDLNVTLIDFGSACFEQSTLYTYIQSRHYRSPEVLLGLQYTCAIDMWSLGCIAGELFLGIPIFPGANEYNQLYKITDMLGLPPTEMIARGNRSHKFFKPDPLNPASFVLKSESEYERDNGVRLDPDKRYFVYRNLAEIVEKYPLKTGYSASDETPANTLKEIRRSFLHFLRGVLQMDPTKRWTADQARQHPFITEQVLPENYQPPPPRRRPQTMLPNKPKDSISSSMRQQGDVCGLYHRFTTALRNGQVIDVVTSNVLCQLSMPVNPPPSLKPAPEPEGPRRFRSKSDAVTHPPDPRSLGSQHPRGAGPEPMAGVSTAARQSQQGAPPVTAAAIAGSMPMSIVPPPQQQPPQSAAAAAAAAASSYRTSAAMPIAAGQPSQPLAGSQPRLSTSAVAASAAAQAAAAQQAAAASAAAAAAASTTAASGRGAPAATGARRSSVSDVRTKDKKTRRASGKRGSGMGIPEDMAVAPTSPSGGSSSSGGGGGGGGTWNPFDLESSFSEDPPASQQHQQVPTVQASQMAPATAAFNATGTYAGIPMPQQQPRVSLGTSWTGSGALPIPSGPGESFDAARSWSQQQPLLIPGGMRQQQTDGLAASPSGRYHAPPVSIALGGAPPLPPQLQQYGPHHHQHQHQQLPPGAGHLPIMLGSSATTYNPLEAQMHMQQQQMQQRTPRSGAVYMPGGSTSSSTVTIPISGPRASGSGSTAMDTTSDNP